MEIHGQAGKRVPILDIPDGTLPEFALQEPVFTIWPMVVRDPALKQRRDVDR